MATPYPYVSGAVLTAAQLNDGQNLPINDVTANYVLVNNDRYKRVIMNNAGSTTITVNNNVFVTGDVIQISNKGAGSTVVTAGVGVTINTAGSLTLAQYGGGYLLALSASTFTFFNLGAGTGYGTATGGSSSSITVGGINYTLLTFTSDTNLVVSKSGLFDVLLVGGGGGASGARGSFLDRGGSGGGAGGLIQTTLYLAAATYAVDIGAGGTGGANDAFGTMGLGSSIGTVITAPGGGMGGPGNETLDFSAANGNGCKGGSNGGSGFNSTAVATTIDSVTGKIGGQSNGAGAGGGGYSQAGANNSGGNGGAGGNGYDVSAFIGGSALYKATGGGGGGNGGTPGAGGNSSANSNAGATGTGNSATANSGSGAGGGGGTGGAGGSGIVYVRFKV